MDGAKLTAQFPNYVHISEISGGKLIEVRWLISLNQCCWITLYWVESTLLVTYSYIFYNLMWNNWNIALNSNCFVSNLNDFPHRPRQPPRPQAPLSWREQARSCKEKVVLQCHCFYAVYNCQPQTWTINKNTLTKYIWLCVFFHVWVCWRHL